jgi:hypothetical protein
MDKTDALSNIAVLGSQWLSYWVVPVGMLLLYFYGRVHFNTPGYALTQNDENGQPLSDPGRLVSLAPPLFTTARSRFNRYAWRYILILEVAFLALLFLPSLFSDVGSIQHLQLPLPPSSESLQYRALFALFALTGLLASFPILKDVDGHILHKLHVAAYIPEDATRLAEILRAADFVANPATKAAVHDLLTKRDSQAVSRGECVGTLEAALLRTLWLRAELLQLITEQQHLSFRLAMARDIADVSASWANLKPTLLDYFDSQEKLIAAPVADVDAKIYANSSDPQFAALSERRQQLTKRCVALFQRMCLLLALLLYGTKTTPDEMGKTMKKVGFQIEATATPAWDWNTIAGVAVSVFAASVVVNVALIFMVFWWRVDNDWSRSLTRSEMLLDAVVDTVPFALVLLIAIRLKRYCRFNPVGSRRPENLLVAVCSLVACTLYYLALQLAIGGRVTAAPLLLAISPCIAGYFAGRYIDNSLSHRPLSWRLVCGQAIVQALGTAMAVFFSISVEDPIQTAYIVGYAGLESAVIGFLIGYLFQRFYQRSEFVSTTTLADVAYKSLGHVGS